VKRIDCDLDGDTFAVGAQLTRLACGRAVICTELKRETQTGNTDLRGLTGVTELSTVSGIKTNSGVGATSPGADIRDGTSGTWDEVWVCLMGICRS
jgi:hypothetical protein